MNNIYFSPHQTEADIKIKLAHLLFKAGFNVVSEHIFYTHNIYQQQILKPCDLILLDDNNKPYLVIELKKGKTTNKVLQQVEVCKQLTCLPCDIVDKNTNLEEYVCQLQLRLRTNQI
jgi:hypothetical protein